MKNKTSEQYKRKLLKSLRAERAQYSKEHDEHLEGANRKANQSCVLCNMYWQTEKILNEAINLVEGRTFDHRIIERIPGVTLLTDHQISATFERL